jgi:SAM-dependent methyltransferase
MNTANTHFEDVTEAAGSHLSSEAMSMISTRYFGAQALSSGRRVLEVACGSGSGLGMLEKAATYVAAGDLNTSLLLQAQHQYRGRIALSQFSAVELPFATGTFDLVVFLEASYYLENLEQALDEFVRVLTTGGKVWIANANPERPDFIKSPYSIRYHSADDFRSAFTDRGFEVSTYAAFPIADTSASIANRFLKLCITFFRWAAEQAGLVPRTLQGRARLKKMLGIRLRPLPKELDENEAEIVQLVEQPPGPITNFKVIYVEATKRA